MKRVITLSICLLLFLSLVQAQTRLIPVAEGWAGNSVNAVVFRKNSLVTFKETQFVAFYAADGHLILGKRNLQSTKWTLDTTQYKGNIRDAHNTISIMVDGNGFLHVAWDHHGNRLNYARSIAPLSLKLTEKLPMTSLHEASVTYPEFYKTKSGNLIFLYRDGRSGKGNLVVNRYSVKERKWSQLHANLIDGKGKQNAYWQACIDQKGVIHLSWVWRDSPDVASNHDMMYAKSTDGGQTWVKSTGEPYTLPITADNAEIACKIDQNSELINQTSMTTDRAGHPFIATYWKTKESAIPQYRVIAKYDDQWRVINSHFRSTSFSLSGMGTKRIPIARPQIFVSGKGAKSNVSLLYRDAERGDKVSLAICRNILSDAWEVNDLIPSSVGAWEPSFDTELWNKKEKLHLFVQNVDQKDAEGVMNVAPQMIYVVEIK